MCQRLPETWHEAGGNSLRSESGRLAEVSTGMVSTPSHSLNPLVMLLLRCSQSCRIMYTEEAGGVGVLTASSDHALGFFLRRVARP